METRDTIKSYNTFFKNNITNNQASVILQLFFYNMLLEFYFMRIGI